MIRSAVSNSASDGALVSQAVNFACAGLPSVIPCARAASRISLALARADVAFRPGNLHQWHQLQQPDRLRREPETLQSREQLLVRHTRCVGKLLSVGLRGRALAQLLDQLLLALSEIVFF